MMTPDKGWLKQRFIKATRPYIGTGKARSKHSNYLHNVMFKKYVYDNVKADECLENGNLEMLFEILWPCLSATFLAEADKGQRMIRDSNFTMSSSDGDIIIRSENSNREYKINLAEGTCSCPHGRKLSFCGLMCKHVMCVYSQLPTAVIAQQMTTERGKTSPTVRTGIRRLNLN